MSSSTRAPAASSSAGPAAEPVVAVPAAAPAAAVPMAVAATVTASSSAASAPPHESSNNNSDEDEDENPSQPQAAHDHDNIPPGGPSDSEDDDEIAEQRGAGTNFVDSAFRLLTHPFVLTSGVMALCTISPPTVLVVKLFSVGVALVTFHGKNNAARQRQRQLLQVRKTKPHRTRSAR